MGYGEYDFTITCGKRKVSLVDDVLPIILEEFGECPLNERLYAMISEFMRQQLCAAHCAGISVVCIPQFSGNAKTGNLFIQDFIYEVIK